MDEKDKIAKSMAKLGETLTGVCSNVTSSAIGRGDCAGALDVGACLDARTSCGLCRTLELAEGLEANCDEVDNGISDLSCP